MVAQVDDDAMREEALRSLSPPTMVFGGPNGEGNGVVGAIPASVDISALGGATYTIPIQVPEGINGMHPDLSIVYNSQSGNGLLGWGWNLAGVSAITRVGPTMFHDLATLPVDFENDRFALDGQRLMAISGEYGADQAEYKTEVDGLAKIVSHRASNDTTIGPAWFEVRTPQGLIMEFGRTWDSRIGLQQSKDACLWLLNKVEDRNGNYVEYHYNRGGASYALSYIKYTGRPGLSPCYTVYFDYANREDEEKSFIGNNTIDLRKLLTSIRVLWWDKEMIRYDFEYDVESGHHNNLMYYNRLLRIYYANGYEDPVGYNPTIINWGKYSPECLVEENKSETEGRFVSAVFDKNWEPYVELHNKLKIPGDFNGDGLADFIFVEKDENNASSNRFHLCMNRGFQVNGEGGGELQFEEVLVWSASTDWIYVCDVNGDGMDDIAYYVYHSTNGYYRLLVYESQIDATGNNTFHRVEIIGELGGHLNGWFYSPHGFMKLLVGDFIGQGKHDILLALETGTLRLYYTNGEIHFEQIAPLSAMGKYKTGDFDGDGCTEIWHAGVGSNGKIIKYYGINYEKTIVCDNFLYYTDEVFLGDFNGDGHTDFLFYESDGSWKIWLFKQNRISYPTFNVPFILENYGAPGYHGESIQELMERNRFFEVADFDGDGKADIMIRFNGHFYVYYGPLRKTGNTCYFAHTEFFEDGNVGIGGNTRDYGICVGNFIGRTNQTILGGVALFSKYPHSSHYSVENIVDGMGNRIKFEYDYLIPDVIEPGEEDFYTLNDDNNVSPTLLAASTSTPLPMKALKKVSTYNDYSEEPTTSITYQYKNALVNKTGRGFLGFAGITVNSYVNDGFQGRTTRHFSAEPMWQFCSLVPVEECAYNKLGVLTSKAEYVYSKRLVPGKKVYMPLVDQVRQYGYDVEGNFISKRITENVYETDLNSFYYYNRIVRKTEENIGMHERAGTQSVSACDFATTNHTEYLTETPENLSSWVINRPSFVRSERRRRNDPNGIIRSQTSYAYATDNPFLPSRVTTYPGGDIDNTNGLATYMSYNYDAAGNVVDDTLCALDGSLEKVYRHYEYYPNYRFPKIERNQLGYDSETNYNLAYGELTRTIDCNGLVTSYWRDDHLGSTDWTKSPYNVYSCIAKRWAIVNNALVDNAPEKSAYYIWSRSTDGYPTRVFYDASGRELRTVREGINGEIIYFDTEYDALGRVHKVYEPYFKDSPEPRLYSEYSYDNYDRLYRTDYPDGTCKKTSWDVTAGRISTTNVFIGADQVQSTRTTSNIMGWTIESMDSGGNTVFYYYYADGKLRKAGLNPDIEITLQYDDNGNRTTLSDPNYGTVTTRYNAYGQLVITTSPKGDETEYEYDVLGRMVERFETDYSNQIGDYTKWEYHNIGPNKGLLNTIKHNTDEQTVEYVYDDRCRVEAVLETRGNKMYKTVYHYNNNTGRVEKVVYPTGFVIGKEYENGHLRNITDERGDILWHTAKKNAMGQITEYKLGNGVVGSMSYYPETHRLETQVAVVNGKKVQDFYYDYDVFGNLASRTERKYTAPMTESFGYDELNRLKTIALNGVVSSMWYDDYGRIGSKMAGGEMVFYEADYDNRDRPHAIRGAEINNSAFPMNVQQFDVAYTMFDKVKSVIQDRDCLDVDYGYDHQRIAFRQYLYQGDVVSKGYVGNCEYIKGPDRMRTLTYLTGPMGVFAVCEQLGDLYKDGDDKGKTCMHYLLKDHLGSITTITNAEGAIEQELSFDAWGNLRNPYTWTGPFEGKPMLDRGFTGHEHHYAFGLINMNGRMYDPVMSSFLSVDNYVQCPESSQGFNRYAYCLNNPLRYVDPDGEWFLTGGVGFGKREDGTYGLTSVSVGVNFGYFGFGVNLGFDNSGVSSFGVYGELGPHVGCAGANLTLSVGYDFRHSTLTGSLSANYGISLGGSCNLGVGVSGSATHSLSSGDTHFGWGANLGIGLKGDIWGAGLGGSYSRCNGQNSFGWGLSGYYDIPRVYDFNIHDNHQSKQNYCVPGALEEVSNSLGINASVDFWMGKYRLMQEGRGKGTISAVLDGDHYKLVMTYPDYQFAGVPNSDIINLVNSTGWSYSEMIWPQSDINVFADVYRNNGRVMVGMLVNDGASGHMAMVSRVKIHTSGAYKVYFSDTSPVHHVPTVSSNLIRDLGGARFYSFKLRY